jgi:putative membrane protein insertion efficiency factor
MNAVVSFILLIPRNAAVLVLRGYRAAISPLYGDVCRYDPSCSHYTLEAIQEYGLLRGSGYGILRIARCHPWAAGGVDDVPRRDRRKYELTPFGFVVAIGHGKG